MKSIIAIAAVLPLLGCSASVETNLAGMVLGNREATESAIESKTGEHDREVQKESISSKGRKDLVEVAYEKQTALNEMLSLRSELSLIEAPVQTSSRQNLLDLRENHADRVSEMIKRSSNRIKQDAQFDAEADSDGN